MSPINVYENGIVDSQYSIFMGFECTNIGEYSVSLVKYYSPRRQKSIEIGASTNSPDSSPECFPLALIRRHSEGSRPRDINGSSSYKHQWDGRQTPHLSDATVPSPSMINCAYGELGLQVRTRSKKGKVR